MADPYLLGYYHAFQRAGRNSASDEYAQGYQDGLGDICEAEPINNQVFLDKLQEIYDLIWPERKDYVRRDA